MNTQLIIPTSGVVDLFEDIPMSLNYSVADIKEPQKRHADYSKTVTVPGTNNNNKLLAHIYEIGIDRLYNPNHKTEARILYGGVEVFKGYMRLAKIRNVKGKIEYDLELRGRLDDLFINLTDKKLTDLSWSDLNHTYNQTNIINSWSTPVGSNYVYPFIDYGYEPNINNISVDHLYPAVYVKEAWDRIFREAGFQYSSSFLTSTYFKSLIMPFTGENMRLSSSQLTARDFKASRSSDQTHTFTTNNWEYPTIVFNNDSTGTNVDGGANFNTSTGHYTVPANGYYNFVCNLTVNFNKASTFGWARIIKNNVAVSFSNPLSPSAIATDLSIQALYSGFMNTGDVVYCDMQTEHLPLDATATLTIKSDSYFYGKAEPILKNGDTVTFQNTLPAEMKVTDFIVSIMKMHNLYFEYDKDVPNKIYIEPRNDYYNSTVQDWSGKLDVSKEPEIIPMGALNAKRYRFTYKQDRDVLNDTYFKTYGEIYGEKRKDVDNDFLKNTETMEVMFSPTPQYSLQGTGKYYPALYNVDSSMKVVHNKSMNPRILYYGGLKSCSTWYLYTTSGTTFTYSSALTTYPYCGMMDDPDNPTISLDFEAPFQVFYTPSWQGAYSNNNLYNKYWKQFIEEITDYNSSIVTGWFWLSPLDISLVDFRHVYYFLGQNFRLNKIYDYNPSAKSLTKCEFIKIKNGIPFVPETNVISGQSATYGAAGLNNTRVPNPPANENQGGNSFPTIGNINQITGSLNNVSPTATGVVINGNFNSVGTGSSNITILNSSGCVVAGGLTNVSIYNSSGVTVTESNTIVENNVVIVSPSTGANDLWVRNGINIYNGNTGNVGIGITSPTEKFHLKDGHFKSTQTTAPTVSGTGTGLNSVTLSADSTDSKGTINTTTSGLSGTITLSVLFNIAYAAAPKVLFCAAAPSAGSQVAGGAVWVSNETITGFDLNFSTANNDPSFNYWVIG